MTLLSHQQSPNILHYLETISSEHVYLLFASTKSTIHDTVWNPDASRVPYGFSHALCSI